MCAELCFAEEGLDGYVADNSELPKFQALHIALVSVAMAGFLIIN